jgi:hypothetical protein
VFAPGSGIPVYGTRRTRFLYVVTNTVRDGVAEEGFWDTTTLEPGRYIVRIVAEDSKGNRAIAGRDLAVVVGNAWTEVPPPRLGATSSTPDRRD